MTLFVQLFAAFWGAFFDAMLSNLPKLSAAWQQGQTTTINDAKLAPKELTDDLNAQIDAAIQAGKLPPPGTAL